MSLSTKTRFAITLACLLGLLAFGTALAYVTINTDNGQDDWSGPAFLTDPAGDAGAGYDIHNFWVGTDASNPSNFYFRAELDSRLPQESYLEARLDCDHNGSFSDAVDMLVEYLDTSTGEHDAVYAADPFFNRFDTWLPQYGETTSTPGAYEWRVPTSGGTVGWFNCNSGTIGVMLATVNGNTYADVDTTAARDFNVPTAVRLESLQARSARPGSLSPLAWMILLGAVAASLAGTLWLRGRVWVN